MMLGVNVARYKPFDLQDSYASYQFLYSKSLKLRGILPVISVRDISYSLSSRCADTIKSRLHVPKSRHSGLKIEESFHSSMVLNVTATSHSFVVHGTLLHVALM